MGQIIGYVLFTVVAVLGAKWFIEKDGHPKGLFYLFFAEMWERFSFYGMRALLVLYIIKDYMSSLENNEEIAYGIYAAYGALVYATPLLGGFIADKFIGYRKAIMLGGVLMALGHFFMAFPTDLFFYGALGLLIAGNGFFKPNISSLVGSLYKEGDIKRDSGFTIFYMGINLGAAVAPLLCGYIGAEWGWHYGFGLAGIGMLAGVVVFWDGIRKGVFGDKGLQPEEYKNKTYFNLSVEKLVWILGCLIVPISAYLILLEAGGTNFLGSIINILLLISVGYAGFLMYENYKKGEPAVANKIGSILILAVLCAVFWACFEQAGSSIVVWADKCMNLGFMVDASQTNAINPAYIIFLAFPFALLWQKLDLWKKNPNTPKKFALGVGFLGLGFLVFAYSVNFINEAGKLPFSTLWIGWLLITTGELCLSPIGLSKVTQLSPKKSIAFFMGLWFLSSTVAHYIAGALAKLTTTGEKTSSSGILGKLNNMLFNGVDMNANGVAEAMIYNDLFGKIGFITIGIAILTLIVSPIIKKLMGDVH
ncbi:MAG: MFS transporter [Flavobacteriales bacterium]|nr:MFS transporter [Flavobacteriales bacterium]